MARLFISHSTKDRLLAEGGAAVDPALRDRLTRVQRVRDATVSTLEARGHFILFDQHELKPGDDWRSELLAWLGLCDGAAIFLTPDSALSDWVRYEAAILTWRRWANDRLRVVPVLLGIDESDLDRLGFGPHGMKDVQALRATTVELAAFAANDADAIQAFALRLAERFDGLGDQLGGQEEPNEPIWRWGAELVTRLFPAREEILERAWTVLKIPPREWGDKRARLTVLAHYLLEADVQTMQEALVTLKAGYVDPMTWVQLVQLVAPAWVEPGPACVLARPPGSAGADARAPAFQLRTRFERALKDYIHRALFPVNPDRLVAYGLAGEGNDKPVDLPPVGEVVDDLVTRLEGDLAARTHLYDYFDGTRDEMLDALNEALAIDPFFVGVNASVFSCPEVVEKIRTRFHAARFVFCVWPPLPAGAEPTADVELIPPPDSKSFKLVGQLRGTLLPRPKS